MISSHINNQNTKANDTRPLNTIIASEQGPEDTNIRLNKLTDKRSKVRTLQQLNILASKIHVYCILYMYTPSC